MKPKWKQQLFATATVCRQGLKTVWTKSTASIIKNQPKTMDYQTYYLQTRVENSLDQFNSFNKQHQTKTMDYQTYDHLSYYQIKVNHSAKYSLHHLITTIL